jgi:hypothetical protein
MTESESYISYLNSVFFFKEFTFGKNKFKVENTKEELELADNVVWLDKILFITQIKERNSTEEQNLDNWFKNKVINKAVKQIKNTITYLNTYSEINIENEKGHTLNIQEARKIKPVKLIIYAPKNFISKEIRFQKFYKSQSVGHIQLFHIEDYLLVCKYLVTPIEIYEYMIFRKSLFLKFPRELNQVQEQYVLGHFIETTSTDHLNPRYINNLSKLVQDNNEFDISFIINNFKERIFIEKDKTDYYEIIKELAKLDRADLRGFKDRFIKAIEIAKKQEFTIPYRMTSVKTNCGFVFIPIEFKHKAKFQNALKNYTEAHKYDQKLDKTVGMIVFHNPDTGYFDINWSLMRFEWSYDSVFEKFLKENYPFRAVKTAQTFRYYVRE